MGFSRSGLGNSTTSGCCKWKKYNHSNSFWSTKRWWCNPILIQQNILLGGTWRNNCKILTSCSGCCTFLSPLVVLTFFPLPTPLLTVSVEATKWKSQKWFLIYCLMSFFPFVFFFTFGGSLRIRLETLVPSSTYFSSPFPFLVFWYPAKQTAYWIL